MLPEGYLEAVYEEMRAHGALCIADEVQCGFGRLGAHFWAFEQQGVVPDIVALGKPIANGFPMGALVSTPCLQSPPALAHLVRMGGLVRLPCLPLLICLGTPGAPLETSSAAG